MRKRMRKPRIISALAERLNSRERLTDYYSYDVMKSDELITAAAAATYTKSNTGDLMLSPFIFAGQIFGGMR